ncbi:hypothetical protein C8R43DRAFT_1076340 [Mycena crocata]|nr:hypothetical protein C8R43DRAFT_1076340 [Mycena crocata]
MHSTDILPSSEAERRPSLPTLDRHASLWYPDGNLIIRAGSHEFRVFRGILTKQSVYFADVLCAVELSTHDTSEGCSVLTLPYSGPEMAYFLAAIFDADSFDSTLGRVPFEAIAAVLRLSSKYRIPTLRRKALIRLSAIYPTSFSVFSTSAFNASYCRGQLLCAIHLAREHGVDWILPLTLYGFCLEMDGGSLVNGVEYGGARVKLSLADQVLCIDTSAALHTSNAEEILTWYKTRRLSDEGCTGGADCRNSRFSEGSLLLEQLQFVPDITEWSPDPKSQLCPSCKAAMHAWDTTRKTALWDSLPGMFGFQDWHALDERRDAALGDPQPEEEEISF